jgi:hypothetical protein
VTRCARGCLAEARPGRRTCQRCADLQARWEAATRARDRATTGAPHIPRRSPGECRCGEPSPPGGHLCPECLAELRASVGAALALRGACLHADRACPGCLQGGALVQGATLDMTGADFRARAS